MTVLQLISSGGCYGAENMVLSLMKSLERQGVGTALGVFHNLHRPNTELRDRALQEGLRVEWVPCRGRFDWPAVRRLRDYIDTLGVDIIHSHGYKADIYAYLATQRRPRPLVATCHNWTRASRSVALYGCIDRLVLRSFTRVVAVSGGVRDELARSGVRTGRIHVINNGIDVERFGGYGSAGGQERTAGVIGMVGRLVPGKGFEQVIRITPRLLSQFPGMRLLVVGDGPEMASLRALARESGVGGSVDFAGQQSDMRRMYASMDAIVLPSSNEGAPLVVIEAMAAGKPVVATTVGAIPEIVVQGETGLLVPVDNLDALHDAISMLLGHPEVARRMGRSGKIRASAEFSAAAMADKYCHLYKEIAGSLYKSREQVWKSQ